MFFSNSYVGSLESEPNYFESIISVKELSYDMADNYAVNIYFPINGLKEFSEVNQKYFCDSGRIIYYQFILDTGKKKGGDLELEKENWKCTVMYSVFLCSKIQNNPGERKKKRESRGKGRKEENWSKLISKTVYMNV